MSPVSTPATSAWEALFRTQVAIMRELRREFVGVDMSMNEYDVLFNIARSPYRRIRLRDLNENVLITQSSVSRLVDRLVSRGFVEKTEDSLDARGTIVALTPEGVEAFRVAGRQHAASIERHVGSSLSRSELATLERLCNKLRQLPPAQLQPDGDADHVGR